MADEEKQVEKIEEKNAEQVEQSGEQVEVKEESQGEVKEETKGDEIKQEELINPEEEEVVEKKTESVEEPKEETEEKQEEQKPSEETKAEETKKEDVKPTDQTDGSAKVESKKEEVVEKKTEATKTTETKETKEEPSNAAGLEQPPITTQNDKEIAIFAHNKIRKTHNLTELKWDEDLATGAQEWAVELAKQNSELKLSDLKTNDYGENLYLSEGTSVSARSYQAVLCWYKHVKDYEVGNDVSDKALTFTQLLWPATNKFGVGVAYREDTKITYIVARYSPPGNTKLSEILEHVKKTGTAPKIPRIEELISPIDSSSQEGDKPSNMSTLFDVLCHWCISNGDKPIEKDKGMRQQISRGSAAKKETKGAENVAKK